MNVLHLISERHSGPDYDRQHDSGNLRRDAVFGPAHDQGLITEREYLRDQRGARGPGETGGRGGGPDGTGAVTVTTAIVVIALLAVFRTQVTDAVKKAFGSVNDQMDN